MPSSEEKNHTQDVIGEAWENRLRGKGYSKAGDIRFLTRFRKSPYIQKILSYAHHPSNSLILEPGCGSGKFSLAMASLGYQVVVLDYVNDVLLGVRETEEELRGKWPGKIKGYCLGSLEKLPFAKNKFNCVLNEGVLEHWLDDEERISVLMEMARITMVGGIVGVIVPNGVHPLIDVWETQLQGFISTPPMTHYSAEKLGHELAQAGLKEIYTDGIYPWRSWFRLPPWNRLYLAGAALDRWFPLSKTTRQRWAINLVAIGRKF